MRARNLKPGLFKNEELADGGPCAIVLYEGLWCMADRDGKLEDRPKRIKAEIFPYYDPKKFGGLGTEELLAFLEERGFIVRYSVDSTQCIKIIKFSEHQRPHRNEAESKLPDPLATKDISPSYQGASKDVPRRVRLRPDSLNEDMMNDDSLNEENLKTDSPNPYVFESKYFDVDQKFFDSLLADYSGLSPPLLMNEIKKAAYWCEDNPTKFKKNAKGKRYNVRLFLKNWLDKVVIQPEKEDKPKWLKAVENSSGNG